MIQVRSIIVYIDFSALARHLLEAAILLARGFGARVLAATVVPIPGVHVGGYTLPDTGGLDWGVDYSQAAQQLEELIRSTPRMGVPMGVPVEAHVMTGDATPVLLSLLGRSHADVLLLGASSGRPLVMRMNWMQEKLYRQAPCPVLALNSAAVCTGLRVPAAGLLSGRRLRMVIGTRFDPPSEPAVLAGMMLARHYSAETILLHVERKERRSHDESFNLCQFLAGLSAEGQRLLSSPICPEWLEPAPRTVVRYGRAAEEIIETAADVGADLLVIGAHCPPLGIPLWPSLASRIVDGAPCPVLVVGRLGLTSALASSPAMAESRTLAAAKA
jgi:nucleotide-binding universal stress UspA family protein